MNSCQTREDSQAGHSMLLSAVFLIVLIASCAISSSAYLGVNGNMVWRQSDSIAQILSFSGWKGLSPMDDFLGRPSWYATPVYELIVSAAAGITRISGPQGFLTAAVFTDLACFWLLLFSGYRLAEKISDGSGLWLIFLLSVSPLYLHYYSVPIPDTMALALSVTAVSLLTGECRGILRQSAALLALSVACFIKSPVPFVLMVFFPSRELLLGHLISRRKLLITVSLVALLSALLPEYLRNSFLRSSGAFFAQDPEWYFGTLDDRLSARFWKTMVNRVTKAAPFRGVGGFLAISSAAAFIWCVLKRRLSASIPFAAAFLSGWLVFANVFFLHDYYSLPTNFIFFLGTAICLRAAARRLQPLPERIGKFWPYAVGLLAVILTISGNSINGRREGDFPRAASWFLRDTDVMLYSSDIVGYFDDAIVPGGLFLTPLRRISRQELESGCGRYLAGYRAVVVHDAKGSECLRQAAAEASVFAEDDGYVLWISGNDNHGRPSGK